jgi:protein gp37
MIRRDKEYGRDPTKVHKTASFNLPVRRYRSGPWKGLYKIPPGSTIFTCFTSDFFHPAADEWRTEAWAMMKERSDCHFFMVTKRPERIRTALPANWGETGYENVQVSCTCENQYWTNRRLPVFLSLPLPHKSITHEPMLERINIRKYLKEFGEQIESVSCGGESGPEARICDYAWVLDTHMQCVEYSVPFYFHQTGARLKKGTKVYDIPREHQHTQAHKAHLDFDGVRLPAWDEPDMDEEET